MFHLIQIDMFSYGLINSAYKENGNKCKLTLAKEPISVFMPVVYGLTKNGPYTKAFDEQFG